jgi:phasin family protein
MSSIPEQLAAAAKAHFETQFQLLNTLTAKAFEGVEQVIELNMDAAKTTLADASSAASEISSAKDPQEMLSASAAQIQPSAEKALEYNRRLTEISESIYAEFAKVAEGQIAESRQRLTDLIDEAAKNAPPGADNAIAAMKSILANADAGYEQMMTGTRQAVEALRANVAAAAEQFTQAAASAVKSGRK